MAYFDGYLIKLVSVCTRGVLLAILQILLYESYKLIYHILSQKNSNIFFLRNKLTIKHTYTFYYTLLVNTKSSLMHSEPKAKIDYFILVAKLILININYVEFFFLFFRNFIDIKKFNKIFHTY